MEKHEAPNPAASRRAIDAALGDAEASRTAEETISLSEVSRRLAVIESAVSAPKATPDTPDTHPWLEILKALIGSWPIFGLILLAIFYGPLRAVLDAFPSRFKEAQEVVMMGVSFKGNLENAAIRVGDGSLSATIPKLSALAIELLFMVPENPSGLTSQGSPQTNHTVLSSISFPNPTAMKAINELEANGLVRLDYMVFNGGRSLSSPRSNYLVDLNAFRAAHPAKQTAEPDSLRITWDFEEPLPSTEGVPDLTWSRTELGRKATKVITQAVQAELSLPAGKRPK